LTWFGWTVPIALQAAVIAVLGIGMVSIAIWQFSRTD
jgi:hypothetical protein